MEQTRRTFFAAIGAAVLGKYAVKFWPELADPQFLSAEPPLVFGSALPAPNTGLFGLRYYDVGGNLGNYMGIPRESYPGSYIDNSAIFKEVMAQAMPCYHVDRSLPRRLSMNEALSEFDTAWNKMNADCKLDPARLPA